jgi:hypothetical protein
MTDGASARARGMEDQVTLIGNELRDERCSRAKRVEETAFQNKVCCAQN